MMIHHERSRWILALVTLAMLVTCFGCAQMGKYSLAKPPAKDTREFVSVEVQEVEVGLTKDELEPETQADLRMAIIEAIQKAKIYEKVGMETEDVDQVITIESKIVELDAGSQFLRWFLGFGAGKAYMEVACKFLDKETGEVIATGTFTGEIKGGFFGGSADQETMSKYVAEAVARFLKKGE
jgi:hypothetical protein